MFFAHFDHFDELGPVEDHCCSPTEPESSPRATALVSLLSFSQSRTELVFLLGYPRTGGSSGSALTKFVGARLKISNLSKHFISSGMVFQSLGSITENDDRMMIER